MAYNEKEKKSKQGLSIGTNAFKNANVDETAVLMKRKSFKVANANMIPRNTNILGGRFLLALKNVGSMNESCKA